jgi:hypothetical protein
MVLSGNTTGQVYVLPIGTILKAFSVELVP